MPGTKSLTSRIVEVFLTGNFNKVSRVSQFDDVIYKSHAMAIRARALYWDWAASNR